MVDQKQIIEIKPIRPFCTCFFGRLCKTTHKTWKEFHEDTELLAYLWKNIGYSCPYCKGQHTGKDKDECAKKVEECKKMSSDYNTETGFFLPPG